MIPLRVQAIEKNDRMTAFVMSFILPGLGQYYAGAPGYGKAFIASELALWGGYFYNTSMKIASRKDYYSQAALHAGVNPSGKGIRYLNAVGAFNSSFEYNGRQMQISPNPVLYEGLGSWEWDIESNRLKFRNLRERELEYENNVKFFMAGIVLNHFLSALNASRIVQNNSLETASLVVFPLDGGLGATFIRRY